jgi:hypothetical protein
MAEPLGVCENRLKSVHIFFAGARGGAVSMVVREDGIQKLASRLIDLDLTLRAMVPLVEKKARQMRLWGELAALPEDFLQEPGEDGDPA